VFPDLGVSQKPAEVRMGKGKGQINHWVCPVKKGQILFEINGVSASLALQAVQLAQHKLPLKTQFIQNF
jgi:large subunit ribosomal protein L16